MLLVACHEEEEAVAELEVHYAEALAVLRGFFDAPVGELHPIERRTLADVQREERLLLAAEEPQLVSFLIELHAADGKILLREHGDLVLFAIEVIESGIHALCIARAVPPPRDLIDDLVVLVVLALLQILCGELGVALIKLLPAGDGGGGGDIVPVFKRYELLHGQREGERLHGLAAGE